jgi:hypothetical protein
MELIEFFNEFLQKLRYLFGCLNRYMISFKMEKTFKNGLLCCSVKNDEIPFRVNWIHHF